MAYQERKTRGPLIGQEGLRRLRHLFCFYVRGGVRWIWCSGTVTEVQYLKTRLSFSLLVAPLRPLEAQMKDNTPDKHRQNDKKDTEHTTLTDTPQRGATQH